MGRRFHILGACSGLGAQIQECAQGPEAIIDGKIFERLKKEGADFSEIELIYPRNEKTDLLSEIHTLNLDLSEKVQVALSEGAIPIVLGGDHSIAVGTWSSFDFPFGLIWIDAHLDAHTLETSPSKAYHGMPAAALLGYGEEKMKYLRKKKPVLLPEHIAYIGTRSFEKEEMDLLTGLGVQIYSMEEIKKKGLDQVFEEAVLHVTKTAAHFGISLDLDVFDPKEAPGVGSPEKGGIKQDEFFPPFSKWAQDQRLIGFEIVEYNPKRDVDQKTLHLVENILHEVMKV